MTTSDQTKETIVAVDHEGKPVYALPKEPVNIPAVCALLREMDTTGAEVNLHNIAALLERLDRENAELLAERIVLNERGAKMYAEIERLERENAELHQVCKDWKQLHENNEGCIAGLRAELQRSHEPLWRPIAQAPRDGTWVLVAHKCYGLPVVARWHDGDWLSSSNERGLLVDKWSTLPDVQDTRVSFETCDHDPMSHGSTLECDERGALKCTLCNAFDSSSQNTVGSRHKPECAFHEAQADGMQHPSGACDCGATASEKG